MVYNGGMFDAATMALMVARLDEIESTVVGSEQRLVARLIMSFDVAIAEMVTSDRRGDHSNGLRAAGFSVLADALDAPTP